MTPFVVGALSSRRPQSNSIQIGGALNFPVDGKPEHERSHVILERRSARDYNSHRNCAVRMEPLVVLKIAVEEWILVIPFNFERDDTGVEARDVVYFMRN